jgi:hypothetical protein
MSRQRWQELLAASQIDGSALANSTTPTSLLPGQAKITLPAGFFDAPGIALRATIHGRISLVNPSPGTLTLDMRLGSVIACNGGAITCNTTAAKTNVSFIAQLVATCRAVGNGTSANLMFQWQLTSEAFAAATTGVGILFGPASAPAVGTGFDSTSAQAIDIFGTWSTASASNSVQVHQYLLEALN